MVSTIHLLKLAVETIGAAIIGLGVLVAIWQLGRVCFKQQDYSLIRLTMARHLALALEFQLGADILATCRRVGNKSGSSARLPSFVPDSIIF